MNLNYSELERLFEEINEIINFVELSQYQSRRHRIYLGNGDRINFSIPNDTIAHLLGINTSYLISTGRFNTTNSFELIKEMCENPYRINKLYNEGIINYDNLFSPFIKNKIKGFKENIKINIEDTLMMCKYNTERAYISDDKNEKYNYIIVKEYKDGKIGILGLVNRESYYVPMSNQLYDSFEDAKETLEYYLNNQEVTIITGVNFFNTQSDFDKTFYLSLNNKINKINKIKNYKKLFNYSLDLSGDYEYTIDRLVQNRTDHYDDNDLIDIIVEAIKEGKLIDINLFRNTNLSKIIEVFNDFLCENRINKDDSITETYTQIKKDLEFFKGKVLELEEENKNIKDDNTKLSNEIDILEEENKKLIETQEKIFELIKPRTM